MKFARAFCLYGVGTLAVHSLASASACDLNGKTINYTLSYCYEGGPRSGECIVGPKKVKILGSKLLDYWDVTKDVGVEYTLGQTRDLLNTTDGVQRQMLLQGQSALAANNVYRTYSGTASYSGNILSITTIMDYRTSVDRRIGNNTQLYKVGAVVISNVDETNFEITDSCASCQILNYDFEEKGVTGVVLFRSRLTNSSCTID
jgi:hypothetical protein